MANQGKINSEHNKSSDVAEVVYENLSSTEKAIWDAALKKQTDSVEFWKKDSAAAWDKCEVRRIQSVKKSATIKELQSEKKELKMDVRLQKDLLRITEMRLKEQILMNQKFALDCSELDTTSIMMVLFTKDEIIHALKSKLKTVIAALDTVEALKPAQGWLASSNDGDNNYHLALEKISAALATIKDPKNG